MYIFCCAVPMISPQNIAVEWISPSEMSVSWDPLSPVEARGIIRFYTVVYTPVS